MKLSAKFNWIKAVLNVKRTISYIKQTIIFLSKHTNTAPPFPVIDRSTLPNDVEVLKDMVCDFATIIEKQNQTIAILMERITRLEEKYLKLARLHFGQSSEKFSTIKANLQIPSDPLANDAALADETLSSEEASASLPDIHLKKKTRETEVHVNHKGRNGFPSHLTRHTIEHDIPAHQKVCSDCGSFLSLIGFEEREQLETSIEQYSVLLHKRRKYACKNKNCYGGVVVTAPLPAEPIEKGSAGPHLLAEVIVGKYVDHLPLYRLEKRFTRKGLSLNRSTLWSWIDRSTTLLEPLVNAMIEDQQKASHLFSDETTIPTLWAQIPENKGKQAKTNYFWVYTSLLNDDKTCPIVIYRFCEGRGSQYPTAFLKNFRGYLQVDAYTGYNPLFNPTWDELEQAYKRWCIEVACWGHARRNFVDAAKNNKKSIAHDVLLLIGELYKSEADFKKDKLSFAEIKAQRQALSKPTLDEIYIWLKVHEPQMAPKSTLGQAIGYALANWDALNVYVTDGRLEIDNLRSERNMKGVAVGRKNYLFVASNRGGLAAATAYTLVETCRQNGVDPEVYLADVLQRISTHPNSLIHELLPYHWKPPVNIDGVTSPDDQKAA